MAVGFGKGSLYDMDLEDLEEIFEMAEIEGHERLASKVEQLIEERKEEQE